MNPFVTPYTQPKQSESAMPEHLKPPKQLSPTDPRHRMRGKIMLIIFVSIAWIGLAVFMQWYFSRQTALQLQEAKIESQRIGESMQHQIDNRVKQVESVE